MLVDAFADEVKDSKNRETGHRWHYMGLLLVKRRCVESLGRALQERRQCNSEIKSNDIEHSPKRKTAEAWVDLVLNDYDDLLYFGILGLNSSLLNRDSFGGDLFVRYYSRFFRSLLHYSIVRMFTGRNVSLANVYHDIGELEHDAFFPWQPLVRLSRDTSLTIECERVTFVASDHRSDRGGHESHMIQLIDLVLGLTVQLLDDNSRRPGRCSVARQLAPLIRRMMHKPGNVNSRYGYANKYLLSFFPSKSLSLKDLNDDRERATSTFFHRRPLLQVEREGGQLGLF